MEGSSVSFLGGYGVTFDMFEGLGQSLHTGSHYLNLHCHPLQLVVDTSGEGIPLGP